MPAQPLFQGIIFDMDGTLTVPAINFAAVRSELGISAGDILTVINTWPEARRQWAWTIIEKYEAEGRKNCRLQPAVRETLLKFLAHGVRLALSTRNSALAVNEFLKLINLEFSQVITREFAYLKPDPRIVEHVLAQWRMPADQALVVGDYIHDLECGRKAGVKTCFFANPGAKTYAEFADYSVASFPELEKLVFCCR
jgi:HAD superfamily hydrolase (TIGR01509 family)